MSEETMLDRFVATLTDPVEGVELLHGIKFDPEKHEVISGVPTQIRKIKNFTSVEGGSLNSQRFSLSFLSGTERLAEENRFRTNIQALKGLEAVCFAALLELCPDEAFEKYYEIAMSADGKIIGVKNPEEKVSNESFSAQFVLVPGFPSKF